MIIKRAFLGMLFLSIFGCHNINYNNTAVINGNIAGDKNGEIYIIDLAKKDIIKDSTRVVDGHFTFTFKSPSSLLPFEAMLYMWDKYKGSKYLRPIGFVNPYIKNAFESVFYVDKGVTSIDNKIKVNDFYAYQIKGSKQNEPYYKHLLFGDLDKNQGDVARKKVIAGDVGLITKYPYSFYLLNLLYINREQYTSDELKLLLDGFNNDANALLPYNKLRATIAYKQKGNTNLPDVILENDKKNWQHVFDTTAKINMVVFWASWCGPCRSEIPNLKEIYLKYHTKGLSITSISMDNNRKSWQSALAVEKMPWKQLITNDSAKNVFDLKYEISIIPVVLLLDRKRELIQRFTGFLPKEEYYKSLSVLDKK